MYRDVIQLVDDSPEGLGFLCDALEAVGYRVVVSRSGIAALENLEWVVPDAILMDAMMPGLDGFETCRRIKNEPTWSHIPVIFMTGLTDTNHIVEGFSAGGVDYVTKPVNADEVAARLAAHVRNARVVRLAREAVDIGGHGVLLIDGRKRVAWQSPRAAQWVKRFAVDVSDSIWTDWLLGQVDASASHECKLAVAEGQELWARNLGSVGIGETMFLLDVRKAGLSAANRLAGAALTQREAEVLSWVAKGKTNKDVADILTMSPRTVNKHLEHIFQKLGVETRAAATALASLGMFTFD